MATSTSTTSSGNFDDLPSQRLEEGPGSDAGSETGEAAGDVLDDALDGEEGVIDEGADEFHAAMDALDEPDEETGGEEPAPDEVETSGEDADGEAPEEEETSEEEETAEEEEETASEISIEEAEERVATRQQEQLKEAGVELGLGEGETLVDHVIQEREANAQLVDRINQDPDLKEALRLSMQENLTLAQAARSMELDVAGEDDPEVIRQQAREEARQEQRSANVEAARKQGRKMRQDFQERHEYDDDEMSDFLQEVETYVNGSPANGGALPEDFLDVMHKGLRFDDAVADAREEGETDGRNQQIRERRAKKRRKGDGLPKGTDGTTGSSETTEADGPTALAKELSGGGDVLSQALS